VDVSERLTPEDLRRGDYLAASHLHRYALAAELCAGLRVADVGCGIGYGAAMLAERAASVHGIDVDAAVVAQAQGANGADNVRFSAADALAFLRRAEPADVDAVVMFEALEHVPECGAVVEELRRLAAGGVRLVVSVPNSRAFHEDNPYHLTDFGIEEARRAFAGIADVEWAYQYLAEGSLVLSQAGGEELHGRVAAIEQAEREYANTFLVAVGFPPAALRRASAELNLVATPSHNRYMLELERVNGELRRANRQLARGLYGKHDAAAAAVAVWYDDRIKELENRAWILEQEKLQAEARLAQLKAWHDAGRYHMVDRAVELAHRTPVVYPALKGVRRVYRTYRRVRPRPS
jgi:2-polyprenyl-3-methyl-5-hydroxy-6-metoxy-1,4-benzoquinol methylase